MLSALAATILLAGCGGGSGVLGGSTPPVGGQSGAQADTQSAAQAAMAPVSTGDMLAGLYDGAYGSTLSTQTHALSVTPQSTICNNKHEEITTVVSSTETIYENKYFYDSACTELAKDVVADVTIPSSSTENIVRTVKWYNEAGTEMANRNGNFNITGSAGDFTAVLQSAFFVGTSTQAANQYGGQFTVAPQNSDTWTLAGGHADVFNDDKPSVNASFGVVAALQNATVSVDSSGDVTFAGTRNLTLSMGSLYGLTLSSAPPFSVSGGSTLGSGTATGSVEFNSAGQLEAVNITVDTVRGYTVVMTSSGSPGSISINGVVTNSSDVQVATFTVDQYGDGVITYANGNQALIIDWHIVG
ncbi:MAG TPA: hypothetical protein VEJ20_06620 [Candidatus Eremiobacteraceae bacterium]|nr:hypothetical protein [Candidatus Eremiobacteraceae bacterium]